MVSFFSMLIISILSHSLFSGLVFAESTSTEQVWHCLCYAEYTDKKTQTSIEATACRSTQSQCKKLESMASKGSNSIVPNSLRAPCFEVRAAYPWDQLGLKDLWKASKKKGAYWIPNGCFRGDQDVETKSLFLKSGHQVTAHYDKTTHFAWLTVRQGTKEHFLNPFPRVLGTHTNGVCAFSGLKLSSIIEDKNSVILSASKHCFGSSDLDGGSGDEGYGKGSHTLSFIDLNPSNPRFEKLWHGETEEYVNYSLDESKSGSYDFENTGKELAIRFKLYHSKQGDDRLLKVLAVDRALASCNIDTHTCQNVCDQAGYCQKGHTCDRATGECISPLQRQCRESEACDKDGLCSDIGGRCKARTIDCLESSLCSQEGKCTAVDGICKVVTDIDCQMSYQCYEGNESKKCFAVNGECKATKQ